MKNKVILKRIIENLFQYVSVSESSQIIKASVRCELKVTCLRKKSVYQKSSFPYTGSNGPKALYDTGICLLNDLPDPAPVWFMRMALLLCR